MTLSSQPAVNTALNLVCASIGLTIMWLARHFSLADTNLLAGFLLGVMLFALGALALVIHESRVVNWDDKRLLLDVKRRIGGSRVIEIPLTDVASVSLGRQGKASAGTVHYDLVVHLQSGKEVNLFGGCAFEGRMSKSQVEQWKSRLERSVQQSKEARTPGDR